MAGTNHGAGAGAGASVGFTNDANSDSTGTVTQLPSTLLLFKNILAKAEADCAASSSGSGGNDNTTANGGSTNASRIKLFIIATKLVRLNLQDDEEDAEDAPKDHDKDQTSSPTSSSPAILLWSMILDFMKRYPDYALFEIVPETTTRNHQQQQQDNARDENDNNDDNDEDDDDERESVGVWLLPRLLRRLAIIGASSPSTTTTAAVAATNTNMDLIRGEVSQGADFERKAREWITSLICDYSSCYYRKSEGGVNKKRELVRVLLKLAQDASSLVHSASETPYPSTLWLFPRSSSNAITTLLSPLHDDNGINGSTSTSSQQPKKKKKKTISPENNPDKRPFSVTVSTSTQAEILRLSILQVVLDAFRKSEQWIYEYLPETLAEILNGTPEDWHFPMPNNNNKGKITPRVARLQEMKMNLLKRRVDCAARVFDLARVIPVPMQSIRSVFKNVLDAVVSRLNQTEDDSDSLEGSTQLDRALLQCATALRDTALHDNRFVQMADLIRPHTRLFVSILTTAVGSAAQETEQQEIQQSTPSKRKKQKSTTTSAPGTETMQDAEMATVVEAEAVPTPLVPLTIRQSICVLLLALSSRIPHHVMQDVTNVDMASRSVAKEDEIQEELKRWLDNHPGSSMAHTVEGTPAATASAVRQALNDLRRASVKSINETARVGQKRKQPPGNAENSTVTNGATNAIQSRVLQNQEAFQMFSEAFGFDKAIEAKENDWTQIVYDILEKERKASEAQLKAIAALACGRKFSDSDGDKSTASCASCSLTTVMADFPERSAEYVDFTNLVQALREVYRTTETDSSLQVAYWRAVRTIVTHSLDGSQSLSAWLSYVPKDLKDKNRLVRLAAGRAGNAILCELYRINRNLSPNGELGFYFNSIETILRTGKPASRLTAATSVVELARIASGDILGKALSLIIYALAVPGQLRAIVAAQLDSVFKTRDVAPYKFFSPYLHQICPLIARNSDTTFALLYTVTDILRTTVAAFLQASEIARIFLSEAITSQRVDIVQLLAECAQVSPGELLVMNVDICFAPLYFTSITKFEECQKFFMQVLKAQQFKTTFQQLIEGDLPAIILEVLIRADPSQPQQLDNIIHRIFRDLMVMPALSLKQANELLARPGTVLAILGRAGDSLRGLYGKKSSQERMDLLQGMEILVGRVGPQVSGAAPQVMTILQTCFKDREVRCATLRLWKRFLFTLQIQEVKPLIAQTTAVFIQAWPDLLVGEKALVKSILHYFLVDKQVQLEGALAGIADMSNIPGLEEFQKRLCEGRKNKSPEAQMRAYLERLDTVNEATLVQTLKELLRFLKTESAVIHKLAAGTTFSPLLGETVHTLLQTAIRTSEAKSPARPLALQCLGVVGALDPDRMTFPPEETAFVIEYDMRDYDECTRFAIYTIEKVLLRVLRTTNDPQQQSALYLAIQGLASVCGFDNNLRQHGGFKQGIDAAVRQRWNSLPRPVQDVVEPLISASIKVESVAKAEKLEYPLYHNKASYREWLQAWTSDLINIAMLTPAFAGLAPGCHPTKLFGPFRAAVRRGHDLTVPHYVLPFAVFYVLTSANRFAQARISSEIQAVLQDQITSNPSVVMPADSRSLCAQAIFELMDHLNTWRRARLLFVTKKLRRKASAAEIDGHLVRVKEIDTLFGSLPQSMVADAAFQAKSHARALLNYERILYELQTNNPSAKPQHHYERMHHIYAELNEPDGMEGVSVSIISPSLEHQIREHEMTGRWTSAQSCWEVQLQLKPDDPNSHLGLLRCLKNLGHHDSLKTHIAGLQVNHADWQGILSPYEIQSALVSGNLDAVSGALGHAGPNCPEAAFARAVIACKSSAGSSPDTAFLDAAEVLGSTISTASKDSYYRFYDSVVNLHMLHEIETLFNQASMGGAAHRRQTRIEQSNFAARLDMTAPTFNTREAILNMRRNTYRLFGTSESAIDIGPLWLMTSRIAIKAEHLQTAYSAILQANQLKADFTFVQSAKLYHANEQLHRALQEIEQGLRLLGVIDANPAQKPSYDPAMMQKLAKATLRSARWMEETGRYEQTEILGRYQRAIKLSPEWEAAYYRLGQYADDNLQACPAFQADAAKGSRQEQQNIALVTNMELCVHNFARALRFGAKFIYQALPRMVTIWLDFGAWPGIARLPGDFFTATAAASTAPGKAPVKNAGKNHQYLVTQPASVQMAILYFEKIYAHIRRAMDKLPPYMWLSVLPQLVSRINHESAAVYQQLVYVMERVVQEYSQQAIWTMVGVLYSKENQRKDRCAQIIKRAQANLTKRSPLAGNTFAMTFRTLDSLVRSFLAVAGLKTDSYATLSMAQQFPALKAVVPCDIIIPLQNAMTITLPTDNQVNSHRPFPSNLVTFQGFKDEIEIMTSVAKPRKLVIYGSDGLSYRFLCKPLDDLRKDNRFNECTSLINRLLMKDAAARKRGLHIRTYAVIPLHESCGLIEWVPDTAGIRNLIAQVYEPRGIPLWGDSLKKLYDSIKTIQNKDLARCGEVFKKQILPQIPALFHEWFMSNFPEPTAWFKARTSYGRTAAVMSMVGYVLGLGDRHGENILLDTTNGDVVHVDFNCLFGMGFVHFDVSEKIPFRLTQNVIDGFGITGVEGVFRRCCEITLRILRTNRNSLISVLESFVHDPLLDLSLNRQRGVERKTIGAGRNETKEQKAKREEEQRKAEARGALATISHKLKGTQSNTLGPPGESITSVEMTVETLFKEATDPKNLGGMYMGWAAWL